MVATFICPLDVIKTRLQVHGMLTGQREDGGKLSIGENMIAAAGAATAISTNPLWVVKTRLQTRVDQITQQLKYGILEFGISNCTQIIVHHTNPVSLNLSKLVLLKESSVWMVYMPCY